MDAIDMSDAPRAVRGARRCSGRTRPTRCTPVVCAASGRPETAPDPERLTCPRAHQRWHRSQRLIRVLRVTCSGAYRCAGIRGMSLRAERIAFDRRTADFHHRQLVLPGPSCLTPEVCTARCTVDASGETDVLFASSKTGSTTRSSGTERHRRWGDGRNQNGVVACVAHIDRFTEVGCTRAAAAHRWSRTAPRTCRRAQ